MDLEAIHERVRLRVKELGVQRDGPAYIIEHGLAQEEVADLFSGVRERLVSRDATDPAWDTTYASLLVCAVEVGYQFGSTGKEYWPVLSERLGHDFDDARRRALCAYFKTWGNQTGVRPPDTRWAKAFHWIAWPITNAVLPVWLHEPLYSSLLACPLRIGPDLAYLKWMRDNVRNAARLEHFLAQEALAKAVIEALLDMGDGLRLAPELAARLNRDLRANSTTKRLHRELKAKIEIRNTRGPRRSPKADPDASVRLVLDLHLILEEGDNHLRVRAPRLEYARAFDLERAKTRLLGNRRAVSVTELLQRGAVLPAIPASSATPEASPVRLIADDDIPEVPRQLKEHLKALTIDVARPLLFWECPGETAARQVHSRKFAPRPGWWVLTEVEAPDSDRIVYHGKIHGLRLYKVDATVQGQQPHGGADWLQSLGLSRVTAPTIAFFGSPSLDTPGATAGLMLATDTLAFYLDGPVTVDAQDLAAGWHQVDLTSDPSDALFSAPQQTSARFSLEVCDERRHRPLVDIDLVGAQTVPALHRRELAIRISGAPIAGTRVTLKLQGTSGATLARAVTAPLGRLPQAVPVDDPAWCELLDALPADEIALVLIAEVGSLGGGRWPLDPALVPEDSEGADDDPPDATETLSASRPWEAQDDPAGARLVQPLRKGLPLVGSGVCSGPARTEPPPAISPPARAVRSMESRRNHPGLRRVAACWLSWSTAKTNDAIAAWYRKRACDGLDTAVAAALCGPSWTEAEVRVEQARRIGFGSRLASALIDSGVVSDADADAQLAERAPDAFAAELARRLESGEAWLRAAIDADQIGRLAEQICEIANASYALATAASGLPSDLADPPCPEEETAAAIRPVLSAQYRLSRFGDMLALLLPRSLAESLAEISYEVASDAEVVTELTSAIRKRGAPKWDVADIDALWVGWARPWRADAAAFLRAVERAIDDRPAARAIRYAAVRARAASGGARAL